MQACSFYFHWFDKPEQRFSSDAAQYGFLIRTFHMT